MQKTWLNLDFLHKSFQEFFAAFFEQVSDPRYFVKLEEVLLFSCGILAMKCGEQVVAFVQSLTNEINQNEGSGLKVVLEAINGYERQKSDFQSRLAKSCLNLTDLNFYYNDMSEAGATSIAEAIKVNKTLTNLDLFGDGNKCKQKRKWLEMTSGEITEVIVISLFFFSFKVFFCNFSFSWTHGKTLKVLFFFNRP